MAMSSDSEQKALIQIRQYLKAGYTVDALRASGWRDWIHHFESNGVELRADQQLSDEDEREVRKLVLRQGGLSAREWLVKERAYSPEIAKAIVDPFLDEDVMTAMPLWDLTRGLLYLAVGVGLSLASFAAAISDTGGGGSYAVLFWGAVVVGGFFALRGLWTSGRYLFARWRG